MNPNSPSKLLIFDVDGTLLLNGTIVRDTFFHAFRHATGFDAKNSKIAFMGMTDRGIFRILLQLSGVNGDFEILFNVFEKEFFQRLSEVYPNDPGPYLLKGVPELLATLSQRDDIALVLGTGNIQSTCRIKLDKFNLNRYFPVGGFGGDYEQREDVITAAIEASNECYNWCGNSEDIWVIGDTPKDVDAGKANGTKVLAVASGFVDKDELINTDADAILDDLSDLEQVLNILGV